jgi:aspartyl-tRNA(Asn)/glutamyl-tRNA(Gln) amidotransferase subunit A
MTRQIGPTSAFEDYLGFMGIREAGSRAWSERLVKLEATFAQFLAAPCSSFPPYVPSPVPIQPPEIEEAGFAQRMSGPDIETALAKAAASKDLRLFTELTAGQEPGDGYLRGAPMAVKDVISVAGIRRTAGSVSERGLMQELDADCVAALRRRGAAIIGSTNLHELAMGAVSSNPLFGAVVNPIAPGRIAGGSSGGSAAAVAAGIVPAALGTDTGGSIRIPAACCGVVGLKPTHGVVPMEGVVALAATLDTVGPIGHAVLDCALAFAALTDLTRFPGLVGLPAQGIRLGRLRGYFESPLQEDVRTAIGDACRRVQQEGGIVIDVDIPMAGLAPAIYQATVLSEAACEHADRLRWRADEIGEDVRTRLETASLIPGHWYVRAQRLRTGLARQLERALQEADFLICATTRCVAPPVGAREVEIDGERYPLQVGLAELTVPFSLAGLPVISVPWGVSHEGLPIGLQIVGHRGEDWQLLRMAARLEALRDQT